MADAMVVNCEFVRQHLENNEGVPERRIRLCYNGVDLEEFAPRETPRDSLAQIGVVCALRPEKDLGTLIDAFARVEAFGIEAADRGQRFDARANCVRRPKRGA